MESLFHEWLINRESHPFSDLQEKYPEAVLWHDVRFLDIDFKELTICVDWGWTPYMVNWYYSHSGDFVVHTSTREFDDIKSMEAFVIGLLDSQI